MSLKYKFELLMDEAGDAGGSGGSLLNSHSGGSGSQNSQGGTGSQSGAGGEGTSSGGNSSNQGAGGGTSSSWKSSLPKELQEDPAIKSINDIEALTKSYIHAQKLVGADKIPVPGKHATPDDWKQVYRKLGIPEKIDDYSLKIPETSSINKELWDGFKANAYDAGVLPHQAEKIATYLEEANNKLIQDARAAMEQQMKDGVKGLQTEWGAAFDQKIKKAQAFFHRYADDDMKNFVDTSGLGNNPNFIRFLERATELMKEDSVPQGDGNNAGMKLTPDQAQQQINKIVGDMTHPYHVKDHPNHKAAVKEVEELFSMVHIPKN